MTRNHGFNCVGMGESVKHVPGSGASSSTYEIFILVLGVSSLITLAALLFLPLSAHVKGSLLVVGNGTSLVFLADFIRSLRRAPNRKVYFRTWGWLDLLGGIPGVPLLRLARIGRITRAVRFLRTMKSDDMVHDLTARPAQNTLLATVVVSLLAFLVASSLVVDLEKGVPGANIETADDGIWWAFVTITTVGFGDYYPVSRGGRFLAAVLMSVGVGVFGVLTSYLARTFLRRGEEQTGDELVAIRAELADLRRLIEQGQAQSHRERPNNAIPAGESSVERGGEENP
jgi:voltage-gated potassium channel